MKTSICRLVSALLVFHVLGGLASAGDVRTPSGPVMPRLRVDIAFDGPAVPPRVEASMMEEVAGIWAPYGVDVTLSGASDVERDGDVRLAMMLADHPDRPMARGALGSILFLNGEPQPAIHMYQHEIDALVAGVTIAGTPEIQWPTAFREVIVGRVLGRGVAHEIGHYLLRSRRHPETGLMRAPHRVADLVSPDRRSFLLSADEQMQLAYLTPTSLRSSSEAARPTGIPSR